MNQGNGDCNVAHAAKPERGQNRDADDPDRTPESKADSSPPNRLPLDTLAEQLQAGPKGDTKRDAKWNEKQPADHRSVTPDQCGDVGKGSHHAHYCDECNGGATRRNCCRENGECKPLEPRVGRRKSCFQTFCPPETPEARQNKTIDPITLW